MATKIFVRERSKVGKGGRRPRYRILGVSGGDLKLYAKHARKVELEQIAAAAGAEIVYLEIPGDGAGDGSGGHKG